MRFLCEACERLAPPGAFRVEGGLLVLECSRCGVESRWKPEEGRTDAPVIALSGSDAIPDPLQNEPTRPMTLPASLLEAIEAKQAREQEAASANVVMLRRAQAPARAKPTDPFQPPAGFCPKCVGPRREGQASCPHCGLVFELARPEELRPPEELVSTWMGVVERWEEPGAHDKVLAWASERGELPSLGRLYRIWLAWCPEDPLAVRGREEVLRLAAAGSLLIATPPPDRSAMLKKAGLVLLFFIMVMAVMFIISQSRQMLAGGP